MINRNPMHVRLKSFIRDNGLSQRVIAMNMGITEARLSLILNGNRKMTVDDYLSICTAMAVSPQRFLDAEVS